MSPTTTPKMPVTLPTIVAAENVAPPVFLNHTRLLVDSTLRMATMSGAPSPSMSAIASDSSPFAFRALAAPVPTFEMST